MWRRLVSSLLVILVQTSAADHGQRSFSSTAFSDVMTLGDADFSRRLSDFDLALVKFYAPWCGICKDLAPEFVKAAAELKGNKPPVILAEVDCTGTGKSTCDENGVDGYPVLRAFRRGEASFDYEGPRKSDDIVAYMKLKAGPSSAELKTVEETEKFLNHSELTMLGLFSDERSEIHQNFVKLSDMFGARIRFAHTFSDEIRAKYAQKESAIVLFREPRFRTKMEPDRVTFDEERGVDVEQMKSWVLNNVHSLVGHRTERNEDEFQKPLVVVFYDVDFIRNAKATTYWRNRVVKVAKEFADAGRNVSFAISNAREFQAELKSFGLKFDKLPVVGARDQRDRKFPMNEEFSIENLKTFTESFLEGKLKPYLRSEPVPESSDSPLKEVVAETFDDVVNDVTKDVFIEIYSPMCGYCLVLAPKFEKLAVQLKDEPDLVVAKIDGTANELPNAYDVHGFPTIYFVPKGSKDKPILYTGEREVEDFIKFLAKEASSPLLGFKRNGKPVKKIDEEKKAAKNVEL